ncbi:MAG: hypothetical protein ABI635_02925 [Actinomycetota bacterium]
MDVEIAPEDITPETITPELVEWFLDEMRRRWDSAEECVTLEGKLRWVVALRTLGRNRIVAETARWDYAEPLEVVGSEADLDVRVAPRFTIEA